MKRGHPYKSTWQPRYKRKAKNPYPVESAYSYDKKFNRYHAFMADVDYDDHIIRELLENHSEHEFPGLFFAYLWQKYRFSNEVANNIGFWKCDNGRDVDVS